MLPLAIEQTTEQVKPQTIYTNMRRGQTVGMKAPWRRIFAAGIVVLCFCCLSLQVWVKTRPDNRQQPGAMRLDGDQARMPTLGIVVPLTAEELPRALESVKRWPTSCSGITLNSVDLILYFAREYPQELERYLKLAVESTSCFRKTRVVTAALHPEVRNIIVHTSKSVHHVSA